MLNIRRIREADFEALIALYKHLHAQDQTLSSERAAEVWREVSANPRHWLLGGFLDEALVCSCALTVIPNLTRGGRPYGVIENVITHDGYRRQGFGRRVLAEALSIGWSVGCYKVMLATGRKDEAVSQFYVSVGFSANDKHAFVARPET